MFHGRRQVRIVLDGRRPLRRTPRYLHQFGSSLLEKAPIGAFQSRQPALAVGVNGRRILDGLVAGHPPDRILAGLTNHVQAKLEPLAHALAAALDPLALINPVGPGTPA